MSQPSSSTPEQTVPNVVIFGEGGVGKSSLANMLAGEEKFATSNNIQVCTFSSQSLDINIEDKKYKLWDTAGLNDGGTTSRDTTAALRNLIDGLGRKAGIALLVYCIRGTRLTPFIRVNYDLFWGILCQRKVPIVMVVTGLENEENMDGWWDQNKQQLKEIGLDFDHDGHACITTTRGKLGANGKGFFEDEYQDSARKVRQLLVKHGSPEPWVISSSRFWKAIPTRMEGYLMLYNRGEGNERDMIFKSEDGSHVPKRAKLRATFFAFTLVWTSKVRPKRRSSTDFT